MHLLGGMIMFLFLVWQLPKCIETFKQGWHSGLAFISSLALGGYVLGCLIGLGINALLILFDKKDP
tara:strand:+ start:285 stop:482 length:198 start_codon:yes stop_codon:yes gene_type:complete